LKTECESFEANFKSSGGRGTQLSYLTKSKDTFLIENDSSKSESQQVKYYLSKSVFSESVRSDAIGMTGDLLLISE
jgi:hypothetical protein